VPLQQFAATAANTVLITEIEAKIGIPSVLGVTPSTGLYAAIDFKTNRSIFGSGNVVIYGIGAFEYIDLVFNNDHFKDLAGLNNKVFDLKEPYKKFTNLII
jgi:hypothetical protein